MWMPSSSKASRSARRMRFQNNCAQQPDQPLDPEKVRDSIRRLYASGRYRNIGVSGIRNGDSVTLIFSGPARFYIGRVQIEGVKEDQLSSLLEYTTNLNPGTAFMASAVTTATELVKQTLAQNGYYQPVISVTTIPDDPNQQVNITYTINIGPQARIGEVVLEGNDPGLTLKEFRKKGKLKAGTKVTRETTSDALTKLRALYQKKDRLEATVALQKSTYDTPKKRLDYDFRANQGPIVQVSIEGAKVSKSRLHLLVPIFEEGTIDNDLLNEGQHNIREFLEQQGYFDTQVTFRVIGEGTPSEKVVYSVDRGVKHKVVSVTLKGNKYFETDLLKERMHVQKADAYLRSGRYSPALLSADISAIKALYRANGFNDTTVTPTVDDIDDGPDGKPLKIAQIRVTLTIVEGTQQKFGNITLVGVDPSRKQAVEALLNSQTGQPFSLISLSGDRDAVLSYYLSNGFDKVRSEVIQTKNATDPTRTDVAFNLTEGHQVFIDHVIISGDRRTKPSYVNSTLQVHAGDPARPERSARYAAPPLQSGALQRSERSGPEPYRRRPAQECSRATDRSEALGRHVRLRLRGPDRPADNRHHLSRVADTSGVLSKLRHQPKRKDWSQPPRVARRVAHQSLRNGQIHHAAHDVWSS